uniref:Aminotransferase class I/classII large domain-containing protein n=1 Tax=Brassica oleracea var. oleracea TaxID=109376 RepID=A0A0D3D1E7_BRAOL
MNSLGKTFSLTGWKTGWAIAPPHLTWGIRQAQTYLTFRTSTPMQYAAVAALEAPGCYFKELRRDYSAKKEILVKVNDVAFCEYLIKEVGVVASVFHLDKEEGKSLVRFALCNDEEKLRSAVERMKLKLKFAISS